MIQQAIYAGNPRLFTNSDQLFVQMQSLALEEGFKKATEIRNSTGTIPPTTICLDHAGDFSNFVKENLSRNLRDKPKTLAHLKEAIIEPFKPTLEKYSLAPEDVSILREGAIKSSIQHKISSGKYPSSKINCFSIAAEFLLRAGQNSQHLWAYIEQTEWSDYTVFLDALYWIGKLNCDLDITLTHIAKNREPKIISLKNIKEKIISQDCNAEKFSAGCSEYLPPTAPE